MFVGICLILVLVLCSFSATDYVVTEQTTTELAGSIICEACACADGIVDCASRDIRRSFEEDDWVGLKDLAPTTVDLSGNPIITLTKVSELPIQTLNLSGCDIEAIEKACFKNLRELKILDLSQNSITTSSLSKRTFEGLKLPGKEVQPFSKIRVLSLASNDLHALPQDIFWCMTELTTLDLSGNPMVHIDQVTMGAITELTKLKELKLSGCELEALPEGLLRRQRRLERLELTGNRLTTIPAVLVEAVNLLYLNLDNNPIVALNETTTISSLIGLQELHLCRLGQLQSVAAGSLGGLRSLLRLYLCHNPRLTTIDPSFLKWTDEYDVEKYPLLTELYLNDNNISGVNPHLLERWDQLERVDFTNNPYQCDCSNQWMVEVFVPLIGETSANGSASNMICNRPPDVRGLSFAQLTRASKVLVCEKNGNLKAPGPDLAILLGIMIGIFVTFPLVLAVVLLWRQGYLAQCRSKMAQQDYDDDDDF